MNHQKHTYNICSAQTCCCSSSAFASNYPLNQSKNQAAVVEIEHSWARALDHHDLEAVGCILAQQFQDADIEGKPGKREETLAGVSHRPSDNRYSHGMRAPRVWRLSILSRAGSLA
jgi:hypothetical protein